MSLLLNWKYEILKILNGEEDSTQGGAIIFITDGLQQCDGGGDGSDIGDQKVVDRIKDTKVRIITVAFGWVIYIKIYQNQLACYTKLKKNN